MKSAAMGTVFYVADPMCSWCWGFRPQLERVVTEMPPGLELRHVMGGLAPDSDEPMPDEIRAHVRAAWREVATRTGARFEWSFWERCTPRRSTWPACRAVLAAGLQRPEAAVEMFGALQRAYYLEARNPSDVETHIELAGELEPALDVERFEQDVVSRQVVDLLGADLELRRELGVSSFPSLVARVGGADHLVLSGHGAADEVLARLTALTERETS